MLPDSLAAAPHEESSHARLPTPARTDPVNPAGPSGQRIRMSALKPGTEAGGASLAAIINSAGDAIICTDERGQVTLFNTAAERIFGCTASQMLGKPLDQLLPAASWAQQAAASACCAQPATSQQAMAACRVQGWHANGDALTLEASVGRAIVSGEVVLTTILRDVTDRVTQEARLQLEHDALGRYNRRLLEQERQTGHQLAQALHDDLGQTLAALRLHWEAYNSAQAEQQVRMNSRIAHLVALANRQVRGVLAELRPPLLDELGLAAALDHEIGQYRTPDGKGPGGVEFAFQAIRSAQLLRWPSDIEYTAFMVAREAFINALRHASARKITIILDGDSTRMLLKVQDDGIGLAPGARSGHPGHLGLAGMRERSLAIGALLKVDAPIGHGTMVTLTWEVSTEAHTDEPHLPDR